jgi:hypothetical protein
MPSPALIDWDTSAAGALSQLEADEVTLNACGFWRTALDGLARSFDVVLADHLETLIWLPSLVIP